MWVLLWQIVGAASPRPSPPPREAHYETRLHILRGWKTASTDERRAWLLHCRSPAIAAASADCPDDGPGFAHARRSKQGRTSRSCCAPATFLRKWSVGGARIGTPFAVFRTTNDDQNPSMCQVGRRVTVAATACPICPHHSLSGAGDRRLLFIGILM